MSAVLAHLGGGHWWEILLYLLPLLIVGGSIAWSVISERRKPDSEGEEESPGDPAEKAGG